MARLRGEALRLARARAWNDIDPGFESCVGLLDPQQDDPAPVSEVRTKKRKNDTMLVRCLTVKDPWITRIGKGLKPYELRKQYRSHRGMLVLCSSATRSTTKDASAWEDDGPKGVALYVVDMVDCYPARPEHAEGAGCAPSDGEFVWEMRNVRKLSRPVPVKGSLAFFPPTPELAKQLKKDGFISAALARALKEVA